MTLRFDALTALNLASGFLTVRSICGISTAKPLFMYPIPPLTRSYDHGLEMYFPKWVPPRFETTIWKSLHPFEMTALPYGSSFLSLGDKRVQY